MRTTIQVRDIPTTLEATQDALKRTFNTLDSIRRERDEAVALIRNLSRVSDKLSKGDSGSFALYSIVALEADAFLSRLDSKGGK